MLEQGLRAIFRRHVSDADEEPFQAIFRNASAGIFIMDLSGKFLETNGAFREMLGYAVAELVDLSIAGITLDQDAAMIQETYRSIIEGTAESARCESRLLTNTNAHFWADASFTAILRKDGSCGAVLGVILDVNERKRAEQEIVEKEEMYRSVFEKSGAPSMIIDEDMSIAMSNEELEKLVGYPKKDIEGKMKWTAFFSGDDVERMKKYHIERRKDGGRAPSEYECTLENRSREKRDVFVKVAMLPDKKRSVVSLMDVTGLRMALKALGENESKISSIIEASDGFIYTSTKDYKIGFMNQGLVDRVGRDATGECCHEALFNLDAPCSFCDIEDVFKGETIRGEIQDALDTKWYYAVSSPIFSAGGSVVKKQTLAIDITEQKLDEQAILEENIRLKSSIRESYKFGNIIGKSAKMQKIYELVVQAASSDVNAIIYGESGTGKELVAKAIHDLSERKDEPFVVVNCGAIPEHLLESEFFGYKRGAFTGADRDKPGHIALAKGGTLFLDELGEIGLNMQAKLLRAIEGQGYTPVGGSEVKISDVRIIAATNRDLVMMVKNGKMREDFFFRIHVIPISMPPLRDRKDDLPLLIEHFMKLYDDRKGLPQITGRILDAVRKYDWPGNVRELQNVLHRYVTLNSFELMGASLYTHDDTSLFAMADDGKTGLKVALSKFEKQYIEGALERNFWHRGRTAIYLGINRRTLFNKMTELGVESPQNGKKIAQ